MKIFKPNKWNVAGALVGIVSGLLISIVLPLFELHLFIYHSIVFGILSLLVLLPLIRKFTDVSVWRIAWIIFSTLSWFLALVTAFYLTFENYSELLILLASSALGVTVLFATVAPLLNKRDRLKPYLVLICVTSFVVVCSEYLVGGDFVGSMDQKMSLIHPAWQASVMYVIVSALYYRQSVGNRPRVVSRI